MCLARNAKRTQRPLDPSKFIAHTKSTLASLSYMPQQETKPIYSTRRITIISRIAIAEARHIIFSVKVDFV